MRRWIAALFCVYAASYEAGAQTPPSPLPLAKPATGRLAGVKSWGYQLQRVQPAEIAASPYDLVVIDYSRNGVDSGRFTPAEVKAMQVKPDGGRRIVLAYLSIGEAEDYRFYWEKRWVEPAPLKHHSPAPAATVATVRIPRLVAPGWLGRENEVWSGNFLVRFWYEGWQEIIMHGSQSYLARIQDAGFNGVYLDRVDAYYAIESDREDAARRMVDFVAELAMVARSKRSDFIIVPQNAEELLLRQKYLSAIDGVAKEDVLFGSSDDGKPNDPQEAERTFEKLQPARKAGLPVLVVEYASDPALALAAEADVKARGMLPYFAPRKLDRLSPPLTTAPATVQIPQPGPKQ